MLIINDKERQRSMRLLIFCRSLADCPGVSGLLLDERQQPLSGTAQQGSYVAGHYDSRQFGNQESL